MNSIRLRIILITLIAFLCMGSFGYLTIMSHNQYTSLQKEILHSHRVTHSFRSLHESPFNQLTLNELKTLLSHMHSKKRTEAIEQIIQSYEDQDKLLIKKRILHFIKSENRYNQKALVRIAALEKKIKIYGSLSLGFAFLFMIVIYIYIHFSTFAPIRNLFSKMIDFLNNRYTYQFTVPNPNEVGNLHATFNALAQRVISNIEELKSLDSAKSDFLSIVSHELRTPLTSIKGSLGLLKSGVVGELNPAKANLINIAEAETDRLISLVNEILDLAKIEARKFPLEKNWHSLYDVIHKTLQAIGGFSQAADIELICHELPKVDLYVDNNRIQQVLTNLLSNAIKYSPKQAQVTVSCRMKQERIVIEVTDQGRGIAPEDQELIFEKFRQTTGPDNPLVAGTGLGLTIAKAIVEEHGGYIDVKSTLGQGSTFYFILPQWRFQSNKEPDPSPTSPQPSF